MDISIKAKLDLLEKKIIELGDWAADMQSKLHVKLKEDKSPVTEVDITISHEIVGEIKRLFPQAGIITEEEETEKKNNAPFTFVLDPIDGTDVFSQGLPSFCTALAILDATFTPVGAIIYAPRFGRGTTEGLLLRLTPGEKPLLNGKELTVENENGKKNEIKQIVVSSSLMKYVDFREYKGKIRIFGSQILHLVSPLLFSNISLSINEPCYIWDYAASHALLLSLGMDIYDKDMKKFTYSKDFLERKREKIITYTGYKESVERIIKLCPPFSGNDRMVHY